MVPPPSNLIKNYPSKLEAALYKALDVKTEKRYATAGDFAHALEEVAKAQKYESGPELLKRAIASAKEPLPPPILASATQIVPVKISPATAHSPKNVLLYVALCFTVLLLLEAAGFYQLYTGRTLGLPERSGSLVYVASSGSLRIESDPPGAKVLLNGTPQAAPTPLTIEDLPLDKPHKIEITLDGYQNAEKSFTLSAQSPKDGIIVELARKGSRTL